MALNMLGERVFSQEDKERGFSIEAVGRKPKSILDNGAKSQVVNIFRCIDCGQTRKSASNIRDHVNMRHKKVELPCTECSFVTFSWASLQSHRKLSHNLKGLKCPKCPFKSLVMFMMEKHLASNHPDLDPMDPINLAEVADPSLPAVPVGKKESEMSSHYEYATSDSGKKVIRCCECGFECPKLPRMYIHLNVEHIKKTMRCCWCDYTTLNDTSLNSHVRLKHDYKKKLCTVPGCNYTSIDDVRFTEHLEKHKSMPLLGKDLGHEIKVRTCVWCDYTSLKYHTFHGHISRQHNKERKGCIVPGCDYTTIIEEEFHAHLCQTHNATYNEEEHSFEVKA